jgi:hypothetical protein
MPEDVKVPAVGKVDRKWVLGAGAAVAGIVVYAYWRRSQAPEVDPAAEGDQYVSGDDYTPDAYIGATQPGGASYEPVVNDNTVNTNAEWAQRVVDLLEGVGYDRNLAAATIGKYLAGQPLTTTEKILVQAAIGLLGNPPGGALPIYGVPTPITPTPTPTPTATKLATPTLHASAGSRANTNYALSWSKVPGASFYVLKRELGPGSPTTAVVVGTSRRTPALKRHYTYQYRVQAHGSGKSPSNWSAPVRFKVP